MSLEPGTARRLMLATEAISLHAQLAALAQNHPAGCERELIARAASILERLALEVVPAGQKGPLQSFRALTEERVLSVQRFALKTEERTSPAAPSGKTPKVPPK